MSPSAEDHGDSWRPAAAAYVDRLGDLLAIQEALVSSEASSESVMRAICEQAASFSGAGGSTVEMQRGDELVYEVATGSMAAYTGLRLKVAGSLSGLAVTTARVLVCDDSETDARVDREACRRVGARSMVVVPLVHRGDVVGVLKVSSSRPAAFDRGVVEVLRLMAGFLGTALVRAEAQEARNALAKRERDRVLELERLRQELASLVVHDLRSPLAAVVSNLEFLRDQAPESSQTALEAAIDALAATRRLGGLIGLLLEIAKLEQDRLPLALTRIAAAPLVAELVSERTQQARSGDIELVTRVDPDASLHADAALVRRTLDNIVDNAFRYTPRRGRIEIAVAGAPDHVELRVGNTGPAIPPDARDRIFAKFAQLGSGGRSNFGLGLYFCKLAVEAHGGSIWVEGNDALPTVFAMSFPA